MNTTFSFLTFARHTVFAAAIFVIAGCAGERAYRQGIDLTDKGQIEEGLEKIEQAIKAEPTNGRYHAALINRRLYAVNTLLFSADSSLEEHKLEEAEAKYSRVLKLEKDNVRAQTGLRQVAQVRRHAELIIAAKADFDADDLAAVAEKIREILLENPKHKDALALRKKLEERQARSKFTPPALKQYTSPMTLEFRDAPVKMVFDVLSSTTGVNFILDKDLRPEQRVSIFVKQVTFDKALNLLLEANQLDRKIVNENTVVVYSRTPQKTQEYEELIVKTFYLANADPKQIANLVRTILKVKDVFVDDRLNMLVIRDNPETLRLVEKLIATQDLPEPEVLLDVTVIEVKRGRLLDLGVQPPSQLGVLNTNPIVAGVQAPLTLRALGNLSQSSISVGGATPAVNINEQISDVNTLANPRIRVRNREKAKVQVGDRVPVISTSTPTTTGGLATETVTYVDVGIKLDVKPTIYLDGDVAIEISLEVNSLGSATKTNNGSLVYQIGTRNATTLLRLKDGEMQLLAGLINDEDRTTINGLPGLADLPLIGRLFASHKDDRQKSEVVLSITPHIVRNIEVPSADNMQFWSGTETGGAGVYRDGFMAPNRMGGVPNMPRPEMPPIPQPPVPTESMQQLPMPGQDRFPRMGAPQ